jgi:hypothetical protein
MSLTRKQQELINTVEIFTTKWSHKMDEINTTPATYPLEGFDSHRIRWNDPDTKSFWYITRETWTQRNGELYTVYDVYNKYWIKTGKLKRNSFIKETGFYILEPTPLISPKAPYKEGGIHYGKPYYGNTLYKNGLVYKLHTTKNATKTCPSHLITTWQGYDDTYPINKIIDMAP